MSNNELTTEEIILKAAEEEFLEKGFGNTKMLAISRRAGVSHSMLHYYFRTKENLFQKIFIEKSHLIIPSVEGIIEQNLPFEETLRKLIEVHFDFVAQNPKLPHFILSEILSNKENRDLVIEVLSPKISSLVDKIKLHLDEEIRKGNIRNISIYELMMNIISLNLSSFIVLPLLRDIWKTTPEHLDNLMKMRRENNVQFILAAIINKK